MPEVPLPADGREKQIFMAALRAYSDQCEPPELTPGCPFYERTAGGASCGEECRDLLAQHGSPNTGSLEAIFDLGEGYEVVRRRLPRPRRPPQRSARPFDVTVIKRGDEDRPRDQRRTSSLMDELREYLTIPPWLHPDLSEREYIIGACRQELDRRGVDVEGLIRYAIAPRIAFMIGAHVLMAENASAPEPDPAWLALLARSSGVALGEASREALFKHSFAGAFREHVRWWAALAPLDEIEAWKAPDRFPDQAPEPDPRRETDALWVLHRFTQTYYEDWSPISLRLEWRYQHAQRIGPCESSYMAERPVHLNDLARELAERDTRTWEQGGADAAERPTLTVDDFTVVAVENIHAGRLEVAAGIFEGCTQLEPSNPVAQNNYGFCLLPIDPARAYEALRLAQQLGFSEPITNAADQVLALHLLGRDDEARELARVTLDAGYSPTSAYLWERHGGDLRLIHSPDVRSYLEDLLRSIGDGADTPEDASVAD
jgi:hypothetical protein